jgi:hypothetical protein
MPLYVDPIAYQASQRDLLENVRPNRLHMGHKFRTADGTALDSVLDGAAAVEQALRESLAMHDRLLDATAQISGLDPAKPDAQAAALAPAAQALGFAEDPTSWPSAFFITVHGYLARARTPA